MFDLTALPRAARPWWGGATFGDRVVIDLTGVRVEFPKAKPVDFRWDDPMVEYGLTDQRATVARVAGWVIPAQTRLTPLSFFPGSVHELTHATWVGAVWVTEETYAALYRAGLAARLHVNRVRLRATPPDTVVTLFSRKPIAPRMYLHLLGGELNPNAEG